MGNKSSPLYLRVDKVIEKPVVLPGPGMHHNSDKLVLLALVGLRDVLFQLGGVVGECQVYQGLEIDLKHSRNESVAAYLKGGFFGWNRSDSVFPWIFVAVGSEPEGDSVSQSFFELKIAQPHTVTPDNRHGRKIMPTREVIAQFLPISIEITSFNKIFFVSAKSSIIRLMNVVDINRMHSRHGPLKYGLIHWRYFYNLEY